MRYLLASLAVVAVAQLAAAQPAGDEKPMPDKPMLVVETGGHSASITHLLFTPNSKAMAWTLFVLFLIGFGWGLRTWLPPEPRWELQGDVEVCGYLGDHNILDHCRSGGEHFRGCWLLDLVLGKE